MIRIPRHFEKTGKPAHACCIRLISNWANDAFKKWVHLARRVAVFKAAFVKCHLPVRESSWQNSECAVMSLPFMSLAKKRRGIPAQFVFLSISNGDYREEEFAIIWSDYTEHLATLVGLDVALNQYVTWVVWFISLIFVSMQNVGRKYDIVRLSSDTSRKDRRA